MLRLLVLILLPVLFAGCATNKAPSDQLPPPEIDYQLQRPARGAIYAAGTDLRLFEDTTARRVGDILTIRLVEATQASKSASLDVLKDSDTQIPLPTVAGETVTWLETDIEVGRDYVGAGEADQSNRLRGEVTVVVVGVKPNGNLLLSGDKRLTLNRGEEIVRLSGEVRPNDVAPDNTVLSNRVANAKITYAGSGAVADASSVGWLGRLLLSPYFPL
jgi:flagellar L-ring protein precursor FlgH